MGLFKSGSKIAFGFGLGIMAAEVVKEVQPAFHGLGKPLLKAAVKSGLILAGGGREKLARFREALAEVTAEAEAELKQEAPVAPPLPEERARASAGVM